MKLFHLCIAFLLAIVVGIGTGSVKAANFGPDIEQFQVSDLVAQVSIDAPRAVMATPDYPANPAEVSVFSFITPRLKANRPPRLCWRPTAIRQGIKVNYLRPPPGNL